MPLIPLVAIAVALVCPPLCLADPSAIHSPQRNITTKASAGASRDNSTADISSKTFLPKETRDKNFLPRISIACQNVNGFCTDATIREACKTVTKNRIPCTIVLETHRCFDQCIKYGNIAFLGHGSGNAKTRSKGVGVLLGGEGLEAWKNAQCYKHFGRTGRILSFRLKYETMTSVQPSSYRSAASATKDNGSTGQCYHIIAGYAPTTAHTNAECEEYYDELEEHIAEKRQYDILIIAADCNANVGNRQSWAKHKPASQECLGNYGNGRKNKRGERLLDFCFEHQLVIASTCFDKKYYNTWTSTLGNGRGYQLDHFCVKRCAMRRIVDCGHMQKPIGNSDHTGIKLVI